MQNQNPWHLSFGQFKKKKIYPIGKYSKCSLKLTFGWEYMCEQSLNFLKLFDDFYVKFSGKLRNKSFMFGYVCVCVCLQKGSDWFAYSRAVDCRGGQAWEILQVPPRFRGVMAIRRPNGGCAPDSLSPSLPLSRSLSSSLSLSPPACIW